MSSDQENPTPQGPPPPDFVNKPTPPPNIPAPNIPPPNVAPVNVPPPSAAPAGEPVSALKPTFSEPPPKPSEEVAEEVAESEAGALASVNNRIVAVLIDSLISIGLALVVSFVFRGHLGMVSKLVAVGYLLTRDSLPFLGGQSIGKKVMKIQAVTKDGASLAGNWEPGLIRNAVLLIPFFSLVELIVLLTRDGKPEQGYRLGDEWAKTKVINAPAATPQG
ncbi:MAG: RDD family protein [Luteolibacter sp.]